MPVALRRVVRFAVVTTIGVAALAGPAASQNSPTAAVDALLAADRAFSAAAVPGNLVVSISAMLTDDAIMPTPGGRLAHGKAEIAAALLANPANALSTARWAPVRGGVSADGLHGFTFGLMTIERPDGTVGKAKYLSYWVKGSTGWHAAAFKRVARADGEISSALMAPVLPAQLTAANANAADVERHRTGLMAAEQAFSDLAQKIGLGPAFRENGSADAVNLAGGTAAFVFGSEAIGKLVQGDSPATNSPVTWSAESAIVASSGDLGVTFGYIKPREAGTNAPPDGFPFFTIWRRAGPSAPWKYVAE